MLKLTNVSRRFGGLQALRDVKMDVPKGKVIGLIGPNGAGKTTLINCISGLDHPTEGSITFKSKHAIENMPSYRITALGLARTYQNIRLIDTMSVRDNVIVAQHHHGTATLLHSLLQLPAHRRERANQAARAEALLKRFNLSQRWISSSMKITL